MSWSQAAPRSGAAHSRQRMLEVRGVEQPLADGDQAAPERRLRRIRARPSRTMASSACATSGRLTRSPGVQAAGRQVVVGAAHSGDLRCSARQQRRGRETLLRRSSGPGASTSASGSRPNRSCSASQPSTQPGTVADRTSSNIGILARPAARMAAASAPEPARPTATSAAGVGSPSWTRAKRSPPIPHMCWVVTARTALAPTAASAAVPPARSSATPAADARWSTVQTIP